MYLNTNDDTVHSMQIICSGGKVFTILNVDCEFKVILNLVSIYYAFDISYPAVYGFLSVFDSIVFDQQQHQSSLSSGEKAGKKKKKRPTATALRKFLEDYEKFKIAAPPRKETLQSKQAEVVSNDSDSAADRMEWDE